MAITRLFHLYRISRVLSRHGLDEIAWQTHLLSPFQFLKVLAFWRWFSGVNTDATQGERIRFALEELGPVYIKFGQMLSTRRDLLPDDIVAELAKLQDKVPPFDSVLARRLIETSLGDSIEQRFAEFNDKPLASASIAQVHAAKLVDGSDVVVKVLRPNVKKIIRRDVELLKVIAKLAARYSSEAQRLRPIEVVAEFEKVIYDELNLCREAANASQLRRNFKDSDLLYIPKIHWNYTKPNVLVMERIYGIPVNNIEALKAAGVDFKLLSERGVEIFFTQVFRDCFFHADMHPGNVFVDATDPADPKYIGIDCGVIGTLSPKDQHYLAANFLAFFNRDYLQIAKLHVESGWVRHDIRVDEFESAIRTVCEPIFERPLREISFGQFLLNLFQTARRFDIQVQPQLVLLQKTLLNVEGLGRELYPDLDLWATAKPILEDWMKSRTHPKTLANKVKDNALIWADRYLELPELIYKQVSQADRQQSALVKQSETIIKLQKMLVRLHWQTQMTFLAVLVSLLFLLLK